MGGRISKEEKTQSSDQLVFLPDQFMQSSERDESNKDEPDSIQSEKKEKPIKTRKLKPIKICKLKHLKSRKLSKLVMDAVDLAITIVSDMKKAYSEGEGLQEKELKIFGMLIRRIERNSLENYVGTLKANLNFFLKKLAEISRKFQVLRDKVDKKRKSTKVWGKILAIFFYVAYAIVYVTVYVILVISSLGIIVVTPLVGVMWELLNPFLGSIGKRVKSFWKKKEEDLEDQEKLIRTVLSDLDVIKDKIHQLLEENGDKYDELTEFLNKITVLKEQAEEFQCYLESKKKFPKNLTPTPN